MVLLTFSSGSNYSTHGSMLIIRTSGCFFVETFTMVACSMCAAAFASLLLERISMIRRSFSSTATFIPRHPIALRNCDRSKLYALPFAERASSGVILTLTLTLNLFFAIPYHTKKGLSTYFLITV